MRSIYDYDYELPIIRFYYQGKEYCEEVVSYEHGITKVRELTYQYKDIYGFVYVYESGSVVNLYL